jgi:hypothetical protein
LLATFPLLPNQIQPTAISYLTSLPSHGKDNKLIVWKISAEEESSMSVVLPVDTPSEARKQPWVLHILHVNTMNFCSFAQTYIRGDSASSEVEKQDEVLIAVPNTMSSETVSSEISSSHQASLVHT